MSPTVVVEQIVRPEQLVEYIAKLIKESDLPFAYVAKYNEVLLPEYPAVQVMAGTFQKELHGTHTWLLTLRSDIYVMHARLTEDRATRNYNDLVLATNLVALLESDLTFGRRVIAGWVESEVPGAMPPRTSKGAAVVSTRLGYRGTNEGRF